MFAPSGSASLAYDVNGSGTDGPDMLLIHAGVADRRSWRPLLDALVPTQRAVSYDARGYGETTYEPEVFTRYGDALAVLEAAGIESAVVVGSSMGGKTALDLALEEPERVSALVLIAPAVSGAPDAENYPEPLTALLDALEKADESDDLDEINRLEAHIWLDGPTAPEGRVGGARRDLFLEMNGRALAATDPGDGPSTVNAWHRLGELAIPLLVLVGDLDLPEFQDLSRGLADRVEGAQLVVLPGVAHLPHFEGDPACLTAITEFLDTLAP